MITKIKKRNGDVVDFNADKIHSAMERAMTAVLSKADKIKLSEMTASAVKKIEERYGEDGLPDVEGAQDAKTGLQKIKDFRPDVILLDIVMPVMNGLEFLSEIKKGETSKIKVILLTNLGQKEDVEKGIKLGADGYLIKAHFTPSEVVKKVKDLLQ